VAKRRTSGEFITHVNPVRLRVTGLGNLRATTYSMDDEESSELTPLVMATSTKKLGEYLSNFQSQMIAIEFKVTEFNEWFKIHTVTVYVKPVAASYPR
jgi:hypothetical protein